MESIPDCLILQTGRQDCVIRFFPARYQLLIGNGEQRIDLGYSGSRLLERLLYKPGEIVSREELLQHAWADRVVSQGSLNQQIYVLRHILGDEKERQIIQTLPRRGYLFNSNFLLSATASTRGDQPTAAASSQTDDSLAQLANPAGSPLITPGIKLDRQFYAGLAIGSLISIIALQLLRMLPH
jgi:cholera toxin transcriptional activator